MKIILDKVMPVPLASIQHGDKSIWGNHIELKPQNKIMLNASSGKGKSTFTYSVLGLRKDYEGSIMYDDKNIKTLSLDEWNWIRMKKISVIFQDLQLFPSLTVKENLLLKNNLTNTFSEEELKNMLDELGIADKWDNQCGILSMGQKQRVAIIRALSQPFDWLILDEPFSHLDEENTQKCLKMIANRTDEIGAGFVLTTLGEDHGFAFDYTLNL